MSGNGEGSGPRGPVIEMPQFGRVPKLPVAGMRLVLLLVVVAILGFSTVYTVSAEERAVVLRFGEFVRTEDPGLRFKIPLAEVTQKVPVQRQLKEEFGFRTVSAGVRSQFQSVPDESSMLTGDLNAAVVEWVVQYRIVDAYQYLFRVRNVRDTLRDMSEAVMRDVVGDRTVNEVLTVGRQEVADLVEQKLQALCDQYETGIKVDQVVLQDVNPPEQVRPSFNEVNEAQQERERLINEAQSQYNKVIPRARGEAQMAVQQAEGYALDRVNRSRGEAARFGSVFEEYQKAPEVTRRRIYLETMAEVLTKAGRKIVVDEELPGVLPLLNLEGGSAVPKVRASEEGGS